jgi:urea transport system ATP-binding protein
MTTLPSSNVTPTAAPVTAPVAAPVAAPIAAVLPGKPIIDVRGVTVSFAGFKALDGLNFAMQQGELRFVIGPNGAGKTTLLDVLTGKVRPVQGAVRFDTSLDVLRTAEHKLVRAGIGRKFQTATVFNSLTVYENLEAAAGFQDNTWQLFGALPASRRAQIDATLDLIGLGARTGVRAGILAHGEKQWLEIGMLLVQNPKLLLLDEPVAGMTRQERNRSGAILQEIASVCSVLVVEHDMEFVRNFADQVTVLHMGQLLCEGSVQEIQNDPRVVEVYLGGHAHRLN